MFICLFNSYSIKMMNMAILIAPELMLVLTFSALTN